MMGISRREYRFMKVYQLFEEWEEYKILTIPNYKKPEILDYDEQVIPSEVI